MRLPTAFVVAVLIWSAARYLPPYYLELHRMDVEEEKLAVQHTQANALLREMHAQARPAVEPSKPKPMVPRQAQLY